MNETIRIKLHKFGAFGLLIGLFYGKSQPGSLAFLFSGAGRLLYEESKSVEIGRGKSEAILYVVGA